jgi:hypothetical protein
MMNVLKGLRSRALFYSLLTLFLLLCCIPITLPGKSASEDRWAFNGRLLLTRDGPSGLYD